MAYTFTIKPWDTGFFGYRVASIGGDGDLHDFENLLAEMRGQNIKVAYWFFDFEDEIKNGIAEHFNGVALNRRLTHEYILKNSTTQFISPREIQFIRSPSPEFYQLLFECGKFSRFNADPHFGEMYLKLYRHWADEILANQVVLGFIDDQKISGIAVLEIKNSTGIFNFLATTSEKRKTGIGKKLTEALINTAAQYHCKSIIACTHRINTPVWKLLESQGFKLMNEESVFHFWL